MSENAVYFPSIALGEEKIREESLLLKAYSMDSPYRFSVDENGRFLITERLQPLGLDTIGDEVVEKLQQLAKHYNIKNPRWLKQQYLCCSGSTEHKSYSGPHCPDNLLPSLR